MENKIQPILCCVGAEVAGEPTQFLMERTASAAHLDWRVITVEVPADALSLAWQGISVMRFRAVRFFQAYQGAAMNLVGNPSPIDQFIGGITSAHRVGDQWSMWHNSGPGLVDLLTNHSHWSQAVCWLHGDSPRQRSLLAACCQRPPSKVFWTGSSAELPAELVDRIPLERIDAPREAELSQLLVEALGHQAGERSLIHLGEFEPRHFDMLVASQPSTECKLIVISNSPGTRRKLSDQWLAGKVTVLNQVDIVVAEEAFDQTRWIGYPPNIDLLREAYEEYADF